METYGLVAVTIEEIELIINRLREINDADPDKILLLTHEKGTTGYKVVELDKEKAREYLQKETFTTLIYSGMFKTMLMEGK